MTTNLLKKHVSYDKESGIFTRIYAQTPNNNRLVGKPTGVKTGNGYLQVKILGQRYLAHRLAFFYVEGRWPNPEIDHKNRIRHDNRWNNLREATRKQNCENTLRTEWSQESKDNYIPSNKSIVGTHKIYKSKDAYRIFHNQDGKGMKYKCQFKTKEEAEKHIDEWQRQ